MQINFNDLNEAAQATVLMFPFYVRHSLTDGHLARFKCESDALTFMHDQSHIHHANPVRNIGEYSVHKQYRIGKHRLGDQLIENLILEDNVE